MRVRRIKIGIRHTDESLREAKALAKRIQAGEKLPEREEELYFADLATLRKVLAPNQLALLWAIMEYAPRSVRELAERVSQDITTAEEPLPNRSLSGSSESVVGSGHLQPVVSGRCSGVW
jgi:predicted transcriptional regulator